MVIWVNYREIGCDAPLQPGGSKPAVKGAFVNVHSVVVVVTNAQLTFIGMSKKMLKIYHPYIFI